MNRGVQPCRFQATWTTHHIVQIAWNGGENDVPNCLEVVWVESLVFNREVFGSIFKRKRELEVYIIGIQRTLERFDFAYLCRLESEL